MLFGGALLAHWVRVGVEETLGALTVDRICEKVGFQPLVQRLGLGRSPTRVVGFLSHLFVMVLFLMTAAEVAGVGVVREYLSALLVFLPRLFAAAVVRVNDVIATRERDRRSADVEHLPDLTRAECAVEDP